MAWWVAEEWLVSVYRNKRTTHFRLLKAPSPQGHPMTARPDAAPKALSKGEEAFALHCRVEGLKPIREHVFHPRRKWRFDFAFPDKMVAIEIEGGVGGRHQRIGGFVGDCYKYNAAAGLGWRVFRYTTAMVMSGEAIAEVMQVLL